MDLEGQVAIVTGGSRGIGRSISLAFAECGASVVINYRKDAKSAEDVADEIRKKGRQAFLVSGDVSISHVAEMLMKETAQRFGRIDILVNNAGIASRGRFIQVTDIEEWNMVLSTNLYSVFNCSKAVLSYMRSSKNGNIINISSISARLLQAGHGPYAVSKAGVEAFTKVLAKEEGPNGIRVNAIAPGIVKTDMGNRLMKAMGDDLVKETLSNTPLGRIAYPSDISNLAVFLVSDKASFITGKIIHVDGGTI